MSLVVTMCSAVALVSCAAPESSAGDDTNVSGPPRESALDQQEKVAAYLATMDSDPEPMQKLAELRKNAEESAAELVKSYRSIAPARRIDRWKVVHTLGQLRTESALEDLASIAFEPVPAPAPPRQRPDGHGAEADPTFDQEMMIRVRAVEGIEILAREGSAAAERALLRVVGSPALSARRAAVQAYLRLPADPERRRHEVAEALRPDEQWILELRDVPTTYFDGPPPSSPRDEPPLLRGEPPANATGNAQRSDELGGVRK